MAAGHQLKKLAQMKNHHNGPHNWIDYMPRHWSVYTLVFSTASLLLFCFLFYDMQSSPTSLLAHAGLQMGALKAQIGESYLFSTTTPASPSDSGTSTEDQQARTQPNIKPEQKVSLSEEDLELIKSEFEEPNDSSQTTSLQGGSTSPAKPLERVVPREDTVLGEVVATEEDSNQVKSDLTEDLDKPSSLKSSEAKSTKEAVKREEVATETVDSPSEENIADIALADEKKVQDMILAAGGLTEEVPSESSLTDSTCDWSTGKWVYDENYPLYKPNTCPYIDGGFRCVENGRPSSEFQKWRWQPSGCDLPRFDAKDMLERLRGSRMVFVGDSIGRNNWESMLCMLSSAVSNQSRIYEVNGEEITKHSGFLIYRFEDYDCTVEYYRAPFLVPQGRGPANGDPRVRSTLKLDIMDWSSSKWRTADIVIFNTGHWWSFGKTIRGGCYFQEGQKVYFDMDVGDAFRRAMQTVARYVEENMDPSKSQVLFRSYAPVHFKGGTWDHGGHCNGDEKPLQKFPFIWEDKTPSPMISDVMAKNVKTPINFLNITYLSDLRPDGHSSMYQRVPPSPMNHQDCSHWCLPGVPDTWNEIVFAALLKRGQGKWGNHNQLNS